MKQAVQSARRYRLLDELRGLTFISMCLYHTSWDVVYLFGAQWSWYIGWLGRLWQQSIGWTFILLSGFCAALSRHWLRRGAMVLAGGAVVSLVTLLVMPDSAVRFGVLTFLGSAMVVTGMLKPLLQRIPAALGLAGGAVPVLDDLSDSIWMAGMESAGYPCAGRALRGLPHSLFGVPAGGLCLHRLLSTAPVALFVLGGLLSVSGSWAKSQKHPLRFCLQPAGMGRQTYAAALYVASACDLWHFEHICRSSKISKRQKHARVRRFYAILKISRQNSFKYPKIG
jgi:hypothetical protein